ncbi:cupin domain-containing protein [Rheinheimera sp.]|uniref:ribosomal protein uL16 3-hydroxylase n=1 Tax=Rheinheimera sp. TaxID=1869214 RepID=UPI00307DAC2C
MFELNLNDITPARFLAEYWQKKPLLIKGGFKNFQDPISPDELAGLAGEEEIESRIVSQQNGVWDLETGPFEEFDQFGDRGWTLLVQAVDHWHPDCAALIEPFRFIPNWRIDDLMVSFSTEDGGVGPHLDQYDVFIIQGLGRRHWRVGMPDASLQQHCPHPRLLQVTPFKDCIDVITEPGDILYIPPGCPHDGISLEPSLNYSVGFRAPAQKDLITGLADHLIDHELTGERFTDAGRTLPDSIGAISEQDLAQVQQMLRAMIDDKDFTSQWFGTYISHAKHELDSTEPDPHYQLDEIAEYLDEGSVLAKLGGLRTLYYQSRSDSDIQLFINGERYLLPAAEKATVLKLTEQISLSVEDGKFFAKDEGRLALLTSLINKGYWYFTE